MHTWGDILPGLQEPVTGSCDVYHTTAQSARTMQTTAAEIGQQFASIKTGETVLKGESATAFTKLVQEIDTSFSSLPEVFFQVASIMTKHENELRQLQQEAAKALARATTAWTTLQTAKSKAENEQDAANLLRRQIDTVTQNAGCTPETAATIRELNEKRDQHLHNIARANTDIANAQADLGTARKAHANLVTAETDLTTATATALLEINLLELGDPNPIIDWIVNTAKAGWNLVADYVVALYKLIDAVLNGQWDDLLWRLSDLLDAALKIMAVIAIIAMIVACPALAAFLPMLLLAMTVLSGVKLVVDLILLKTQQPHPDTGRQMDFATVALDALGLLGGAAGKGLGKLISKLPRAPIGQVEGIAKRMANARTQQALNESLAAEAKGWAALPGNLPEQVVELEARAAGHAAAANAWAKNAANLGDAYGVAIAAEKAGGNMSNLRTYISNSIANANPQRVKQAGEVIYTGVTTFGAGAIAPTLNNAADKAGDWIWGKPTGQFEPHP